MKRVLWMLWLLLAPLALAAEPAAPQPSFITSELLSRLVEELMPRVEEHAGLDFVSTPVVRLSDRTELRKVLAQELFSQMRLRTDSDEEARRQAEETSEVYSQVLLGKYAAGEGAILVLPENFLRHSELVGHAGVHTPEFLRAVIVHELVHALDDQRFAAVRSVSRLTNPGEMDIWNALLEGHAQHVTRKVLSSQGALALFERFERYIVEPPPKLGEGEKYLFSLYFQAMQFAYIDGRKFFEKLELLRPEIGVERVFREPPQHRSVILHPERYGNAPPAVSSVPLEKLAERLLEVYGAGWNCERGSIDEASFRAACGDFLNPEEIEAVAASIRSSGTLVFRSENDASRISVVGVYRMGDEAEAERTYDFLVRLLQAKDARLQAGRFRILEAEYVPLDTGRSGKGTLARKRMSVEGVEVHGLTVVCQRDEQVIEMVRSYLEAPLPGPDPELQAVLDYFAAAAKPLIWPDP
ncbi:MAG: hypothetical protein HY319_02100 [Armatimonadetes bacterium]|nr:hypothetical protein [Armatimonadota bacterium]